MRIRRFHSEFWLPCPLEQVFAFFGNAHNLDRITPPWLNFHVRTPAAVEMKRGTLLDYQLRLRGLPIKWRSEITAWEPPTFFEDKQVKGPYKLWLHRHYFEEMDSGVLIRDEVDYAVPGWILEPVIHALFVGRDVRKIFAYRERRMRELFRVNGQEE